MRFNFDDLKEFTDKHREIIKFMVEKRHCMAGDCSPCPFDRSNSKSEASCTDEGNALGGYLSTFYEEDWKEFEMVFIEATSIPKPTLSESEDTPKPKDNINPSHYSSGGKIECIDAMQEAMGIEGVQQFCRGNAIKYLWRIGKKDEALQEMKKVQWYINKWIELEEKKVEGQK